MRKPPPPTMEDVIEAFLSLSFTESERPFRTQRDMREEAHRQLGFAQGQEQLRHLLRQAKRSTVAQRLANVRCDDQLRPIDGPGGMKLWVPPEFPVRGR